MSAAADLTAASWQTFSRLLDQALELPPSERLRWVEALAAEHEALKPALRAVLQRASGVEAAQWLNTLPHTASAATITDESDLQPGALVGPYRLIRELGTGGMGAVWLAERADGTLRRQVALKLPRAAWTRGLAERMARERDILAALEHPNIARLYDAGTDAQGRPFLALEYVEGQPIDVYCRERALNIRQRVELLLQVAHAVAFAHSRLVIHRDLKPSNILVTSDGQVRLLDFGIAKLMEGDRAQETQLTQLAGRALTPDYASAEQIRGEPIGTASDVYGLGVVAYELLTGAKPYKLKRGSAAEVEEAIATIDAPLASDSTTDAASRRQIKGDLDAILNKALKKRPEARYLTVSAVAEDLERWQRGEPVMAQPDTVWYRARRLIARHRAAFATGALVSIALVVAASVSLRQAELARRETRTAQAVETFLRDVFSANSSEQADPETARRTTARELLDIGARRIDSALTDAPEARVRVLQLLARMYEDLTLYGPALRLQRERINLLRKLVGPEDLRIAEALTDLGLTATTAGDPQAARQAFEEALRILDRHGDESSFVRGVLHSHIAYFGIMQRQADALDNASRAIAILRRHPASLELMRALQRFSFVASDADRIDEGMAAIREAFSTAAALGERGAAHLPGLYQELARLQTDRLQWKDAEDSMRRAHQASLRREGPTSIQTINIAVDLGQHLYVHGLYRSALDVLQPAAKAAEQRIAGGDRTWVPVLAIAYRGAARVRFGALEDGLADLTRMLAARDVLDANPPVHSYLRQLYAEALIELGEYVAAAAELDRAMALGRGNGPNDANAIGGIQRARLALAIARRDASAINALLRTPYFDPPPGNERPDRAVSRLVQAAEARLAAGDVEAALAAAKHALALIDSSENRAYHGDRERRVAMVVVRALLLRGRATEAVEVLRRAVALNRDSFDEAKSPELAAALISLAHAHITSGALDQARELAAQAREIHAQHPQLGQHRRSEMTELESRLRSAARASRGGGRAAR